MTIHDDPRAATAPNEAATSSAATRVAEIDRPERYASVRTRRMLAFVLDYTFIVLLSLPAAVVVFVLGILSLGLGWMLYGILLPAIALLYVMFTMGGDAQATPGMRLFDLRIARLDGDRVDVGTAAAHGILFWLSNAILTPAILLVGLFTPRKQLAQDLVLGTVVIRR